MCLIDHQKPDELIEGHLHEATVWATVEVYISELDFQLKRDFYKEVGSSVMHTT